MEDVILVIFTSIFPLLMVVLVFGLVMRGGKKLDAKFKRNNETPQTRANLQDIDNATQSVVTFVYIKETLAFQVTASPQLTVNGESYLLENKEIALKVEREFEFDFHVPYMFYKMFKAKGVMNLEPGYHYIIEFRTKSQMHYMKSRFDIVHQQPLDGQVKEESFDYDF